MMNRFLHGAAISLLGLLCASHALPAATRSVVSLDKGWQLYPLRDFQLWSAMERLTPAQIKQLSCPEPGKGWQPVQIPDDYIVKGEFAETPNASMLAGGAVCPLGGRECEPPNPARPKGDGQPGALNRPGRNGWAGHGYLPVYPAWYRRNISIPASAKGKSVWLDFGGIYRDAIIFINGQFIDQHASGYSGFRLNVTSAVRYGQENTLTVFVDPRWFEGWWYEGGGIYRHVSMIIADQLQVAPWGTFVQADVTGPIGQGDHAAAKLTIQTTVRNEYQAAKTFTIVSQVLDSAGKVVASASSNHELAAGKEATFDQSVAMRDALLWSLEHRNLYKLATAVKLANTVVDKESTTFGVRTLKFDPDKGFFLNGRRVEIQGLCVHYDFPGVGTGAPNNLWAWRIKKMKAMGANGFRCAHNPMSEAFYDAADRMGLLVMDENRHLGDTYFPKAVETTTYTDMTDVSAMVLQHRNHPSIIMWSLCNEEGQGPKPLGAKMFAAMKEAVKKIDPTRPTTGGINGGYTKEGYISVEDILGMNYHNREFDKIHSDFPNLMIYGSEDINAKTSRGTLETSRPLALCSAYGEGSREKGPWDSWVSTSERPYIAGQYVWTGFDYRGEPNPYSWPAVTSQTGVMDLCGFPKPVYHYWKAAWEPKPSVYIFPEWNQPKDMIGKKVLVRAFSNCDRVELTLNDKSLGAKDMPKNMYLDWEVPYTPGTLTATGYKQGKVAARYTVQTTGAPAAIRLTAEIPRLAADGQEVAPIEVAVVDANGRIVTDADTLIDFAVSGAGTLAGVANGDPTSHELNVANQRKAFRGLAMVMVKSSERPGAITVKAQAKGLKPATVVIPTAAR